MTESMYSSRLAQDRTADLSRQVQNLDTSINEFWRFASEFKSSRLQFDPDESDLSVIGLLDIRSKYRDVYEVYEVIRTLRSRLSERVESLYEELERFREQIDGSAMRHGLSRLPEEVLSKILLYSVHDLGSTIKLSHVCRKFRSTIISCRTFWKGFQLSSAWTSDKVGCIAERSKCMDLKALIKGGDPNGPILTDTVKAILGLHEHLDTLHIHKISMVNIGKIQRYLRQRGMPKLLRLKMTSMPDADTNFKGFCEMPSLRALDTDFIPHGSLGKSLTRSNLTLHGLPLSELLQFLSSSSQLRELSITIRWYQPSNEHGNERCDPISLDNLQSLSVSAVAPHSIVRKVLRKIRSPALRSLRLGGGSGTVSETELFDTVRLKPSIRKLHMRVSWSGCRIDFAIIPPHVEILTLSGMWTGRASIGTPESFRAHQLRMLRFKEFGNVMIRETVLSCRDVFLKCGREEIQFEFWKCSGFKNGIFKLIELESALL